MHVSVVVEDLRGSTLSKAEGKSHSSDLRGDECQVQSGVPLAEVPSHLTSPIGLFSLWSWFGSHWSLWWVFYELRWSAAIELLSMGNISGVLVVSWGRSPYCSVKAS